MTRKKVKLAYIMSESARKATFKKRKKGLLKKVSELSTLCGVAACAIIYSPYDSQPEVWPPSPGGAQRVLAEFKNMPEMEQSKKMVNQESFLKQRLAKAKEQLKKQQKDNREKEIACLMYRTLTLTATSSSSSASTNNILLQALNMVDLNDLGWLIDQNLKDIQNRMEDLTKGAMMMHKSSANHLTNPSTTTDVNHHHHPRQRLAPVAHHHHPHPHPHQVQGSMVGSGVGKNATMSSMTTAEAPHMVMGSKEEEEEDELLKGTGLVGLGFGLWGGGFNVEGNVAAVASSNSSSGGGVEGTFMMQQQHHHHQQQQQPENKQNQWLMDLLNSNDHIGGLGGGATQDIMSPFGDPHSLNSLWFTGYFT